MIGRELRTEMEETVKLIREVRRQTELNLMLVKITFFLYMFAVVLLLLSD